MEKYQYNKSIRFKLDNVNFNKKELELEGKTEPKEIQKERFKLIGEFIDKAKSISASVKDLVSLVDKDTKQRYLNKRVKIKYSWLRTYCRLDFEEAKNHKEAEAKKKNESFKPDKIYSIGDFPFIAEDLTKLIDNKFDNEDINSLKGISSWYKNWTESISRLKEFLKKSQIEKNGEIEPSHEQTSRAEFNHLLAFFKTRQGFEFIDAFVNSINNSNDSELDQKIFLLKININEFDEISKKVYNLLSPYQTHGILFKKATLNYMTLNKSAKDLGEELVGLDKEQKETLSEANKKEKKIKPDESIKELVQSIFSKDLYVHTLDELYDGIKKWKGEQKSRFIEAVQKNEIDANNFAKEFPLFEAKKEDFKIYQEKTKEIEQLGNEINNLKKNKHRTKEQDERLQEKRKSSTKLKQERGAFFNKPKETVQTNNYYGLCNFYRDVALKRGQIKAKIHAIEKDKIESQMLTHWAVMFEEKSQHGLLFFPREDEQHKRAKQRIEELQKNSKGEVTLFHFKSLTLRALEKLCFKTENNSFMDSNLKHKVCEHFPKNDRGKTQYYKQAFFDDEKLVKFYQAVLNNETKYKDLGLIDFGGIKENILEATFLGEGCLEDFRLALEKYCYIRKPITISRYEKKKLISKHNAKSAMITSYDLRKEAEYSAKDENWDNFKRHTQLWKDFWSSDNANTHYPLRLNPELSIYYRSATRSLDYYQRKYESDYCEQKALNRRVLPQFTLATSFTLNAPGKHMQSAFAESKTIHDAIGEFNQKFNDKLSQQKEKIVYLGLDRGEKELATLCVTQFTKKTYIPENRRENRHGGNFHVPKFIPITAYCLKEEKYNHADDRGRFAIKNLSYFLEKNQEPNQELFRKVESACLDLSMAKVIKGHIILNGDIMSYFRLKKQAAKRKLYELWMDGKITKETELKCEDNKISIESKEIYKLSPEQKENVQSRFESGSDGNPKQYSGSNPTKKIIQTHIEDAEKVKADLEKTFKYLKNSPNSVPVGIDPINHLRDAIAANIAGIIFHIYKQYKDHCVIQLENLDAGTINKHFKGSNIHISRRLEWALYRKFQSEAVVPPSLKQTVLYREIQDKSKPIQYGIISFIETEGTSSDCPWCTKRYKKTDNHFICKPMLEIKDEKREVGKSCGFSSKRKGEHYSLTALKNSDEVASYNVAKRLFEDIFKEKVF